MTATNKQGYEELEFCLPIDDASANIPPSSPDFSYKVTTARMSDKDAMKYVADCVDIEIIRSVNRDQWIVYVTREDQELCRLRIRGLIPGVVQSSWRGVKRTAWDIIQGDDIPQEVETPRER